MNLVWAALIVAAVAAPAVAAMLLVRRRAPEGSRFSDGDRASGVFGVLATGFSVLAGFVVFLSFTSYDKSRVGAEQEALALGRQIETAQFFPTPVAAELSGELICYGRSVVNVEWPEAEAGNAVGDVNPGASSSSRLCVSSSRRRRCRSPPSTSGSTTRQTARLPESTASTGRKASSHRRSGSSSSCSRS